MVNLEVLTLKCRANSIACRPDAVVLALFRLFIKLGTQITDLFQNWYYC